MILATLCYIRRKGKTLMMHRVKKKGDVNWGKWNGLGGKMKPGETPEECVIREVKEESGLTIRRPVLKGILTFPGFYHAKTWYVFVFVADSFKGKLVDSKEGYLKWVGNSKLAGLAMWKGDKAFMKWLNRRELFSAKFVYKRNKYINHQVIFYG